MRMASSRKIYTPIAAVGPNHFLNDTRIHEVRPANFLEIIAAVSGMGNSAVSARYYSGYKIA